MNPSRAIRQLLGPVLREAEGLRRWAARLRGEQDRAHVEIAAAMLTHHEPSEVKASTGLSADVWLARALGFGESEAAAVAEAAWEVLTQDRELAATPPESWRPEFFARVERVAARVRAAGRSRADWGEPRFDAEFGREAPADRRLEVRADLERTAAVAKDELSRTLAEVFAAIVAGVPPTPDALAEHLTQQNGRLVTPGAAKVRLHRMRERLRSSL